MVNPTVQNQPNFQVFAPLARHLTPDQKSALSSDELRQSCRLSLDTQHPYNEMIDIYWEPTPEAAGFANDFVLALGPTVSTRTAMSAKGEETKGVVLAATDWVNVTQCAQTNVRRGRNPVHCGQCAAKMD